ncbi:MAG TPA: hypothetical protein VNZ26_12600 [Vicinamibacterales bacterium]|jgi:hypothetical protein|nr:hypothetical protein [Vicinamibacterales bacterium]
MIETVWVLALLETLDELLTGYERLLGGLAAGQTPMIPSEAVEALRRILPVHRHVTDVKLHLTPSDDQVH